MCNHTPRNDCKLAEKHQRAEDKNELYIHIKFAAESGWNNSSIWFITTNGTYSRKHNFISVQLNIIYMLSILIQVIYLVYKRQTVNIVPVDLNNMLHVNALPLSTWFDQVEDEIIAAKYRTIANEFLENIQEVRIHNMMLFCSVPVIEKKCMILVLKITVLVRLKMLNYIQIYNRYAHI